MVSTSGAGRSTTPESVGYSLKRLLLGKPLITEQLESERLSNPVALGVLSPDAISSSAYGTEEILIELLPYAGLAAFTLVLPITGVILVILVLVAGSYRQVVMIYTRAGGSYVVPMLMSTSFTWPFGDAAVHWWKLGLRTSTIFCLGV